MFTISINAKSWKKDLRAFWKVYFHTSLNTRFNFNTLWQICVGLSTCWLLTSISQLTHLWNKYTREWMDPSLSWPHMYFWNKNLIIYFIFFTSGNEQENFFFSFSWVRVGEKFWAVICYLYHLMHVQIFDIFIRWGCVILKKIPYEIESIHCHEVLSDI